MLLVATRKRILLAAALVLTGCSQEPTLERQLHDRLLGGDFDGAERVLTDGADIDHRFSEADGATLLYLSCAGADGSAGVEFLLDRGANPEVQNDKGRTPLMLAAETRRAETVRALILAGADPSRRNRAGKTALDLAREKGHRDIVQVLLRARPGVDDGNR